MSIKNQEVKLSQEERDIEDNLENYVELSPKEYKHIDKIINRTKERKAITLRMNIDDLSSVKSQAMKEGLPYQTLIVSIVHKYITNQLIDSNNIKKVLQMVKS
jgi:predicted DNA binding CopG/RHH family protein